MPSGERLFKCCSNLACLHGTLIVFSAISPFAAGTISYLTRVWWPFYVAIGLNLAIVLILSTIRLYQYSRRPTRATNYSSVQAREQIKEEEVPPIPKIWENWNEVA